MKIYLKGYSQRKYGIIVAVICCIAATLLNYALFQGKLNSVGSQIDSYESADYSIIYILNYVVPLKGTAIFPDTDVQIFLDDNKENRMTVSCVMNGKDSSEYDGTFLEPVQEIGDGEIILSKAVSEKYHLEQGDTLYAEYPYDNSLKELKFIGTTATNYDFTRPNVDNDIGIVYLGYDENYEDSVQCKYIVFAKKSEADTLAAYPQIINAVINKSENMAYMVRQGAVAVVFQIVFTIAAFVISYIAFFSNSKRLLRRCYLKGMRKTRLVTWPFIEKVCFAVFPTAAAVCVLSCLRSYNNFFMKMYFLLPIVVMLLACMILLGADAKAMRIKKG